MEPIAEKSFISPAPSMSSTNKKIHIRGNRVPAIDETRPFTPVRKILIPMPRAMNGYKMMFLILKLFTSLITESNIRVERAMYLKNIKSHPSKEHVFNDGNYLTYDMEGLKVPDIF